MRHLPNASESAAGTRGHGMAVRSLDEAGRESLDKIKAYLDCRSRGVTPPPPLAEAWDDFYGYYAPRIRTFLKKWALSEADRNDCLQDFWQEVVARLAWFG